ncbi:sensor histidine kinase [Streptosporangium sp. NBC_01756]|uniref:sensor histidine kinase n=1 Tax=Streptosporangium sp. NBC_01756 TaxID=2975950 RepID=UPI002DD82AF7|nr:histidine kinase [Streptosporangium sp. NBC_01756]WSC84345.1 histidine kinase [Streptosporangium sp. NBC_01756]
MRRKAVVAKDVLLWAVLCLPLLWGALTSFLADGYTWWEVGAGAAVIGVAVTLGRSRPLPAMLVTAALWLLAVVIGKATAFFPVMAAMSYLAGVRTVRVRPAVSALGATAAAAVVAVPLLRWDAGSWFVAVAGIVLFEVVPWLAGRARHQHLELVRAGWERAEHLEREQRILTEQVRLRERARIAGDMHDLLGHELSLVALRIGGLEVAPGLDERYREAAGEARSAVTAASDRLREIVEVLRDDSDPEPDRRDVAELVGRARAAGMRVELHGGEDDVRLPPMAERALRRVVQEGLTNAAKHAPGVPVVIRFGRSAGETVVTVSNGAPPAAPAGDHGPEPARPPAGGYGLAGLTERVRLCGGSLHTVRQDGGFELTATLPHTPGPARQAPLPSSSAVHLREARRRVRRTRVTAIAVALIAGAGATATVLGFMTYDAVTSVLSPADFGRLRVGQPEPAAGAVLPARTRIDGPAVGEPPVPAGAGCRYYGTRPDPFDALSRELYRLCFADGRLVSKDFLPADRVP